MGNSSKKTVQDTVYKNMTTSNPYIISKTTDKGTQSRFAEGSALDTINKTVNSNIGNVMNDYLNPSLNSPTNKALLDNFVSTLNTNAKSELENNIINPLSDRNMIRSSQATNMYKNLSNNLSNSVASYANELLANSRTESERMLNTLLSAYMGGFNAVNTNQNHSLSSAKGNALKTTANSSSDSSAIYSGLAQGAPNYISAAQGILSMIKK